MGGEGAGQTVEVEGEGSELRGGGGEWEEEKEEECGRHSSPTPCTSPLQRVWKLQLRGLKGGSVLHASRLSSHLQPDYTLHVEGYL